MSFYNDETSTENANPIELYIFSYDGIDYEYTSHAYSVTAYIEDKYRTFTPDYIQRGDSLRLGDSSGTQETCTISVNRTNNVALLYKGAPPELDSVRVRIYRVHGTHSSEYALILRGIVSQIRFTDSTAEMTITIESVMKRQIPRGTLSYFCQNCIYDAKCTLDMDSYGMLCYVDGGIQGLKIFSTNLNAKPSGYYTGGYIKMGNSLRAVIKHESDWVQIKYPLGIADKAVGKFTAYPGCNGTFKQCAEKFGNTDNFSGIPYIQPYDVLRHPVSADVAYWVDGNIVYRNTHGALKKGKGF